jgi:hypothetical protein
VLFEGWWIDPWQDTFKYFRTYKYKCHFGKPNMEFGKYHPSTNSWLSELYIQISVLHMSVVPGPLCRMQFSNAY